MSKYSNQDCRFFGARTPENQESTNRCRRCKEQTPDMYRECAVETNELLNTSVLLDRDGNTVVRDERSEPVDNIDSNVAVVDEPTCETKHNIKRIKRQEKAEMVDETTNQQAPKAKNTAGVLGVAKTMLIDGKDTEAIMRELITIYIASGKTPKQAKHNAQSCLFNARKKLKKETAVTPDPTHGTETAFTTPTVPAVEVGPTINAVPIDVGPTAGTEVEEQVSQCDPSQMDGETEVQA